MGFIGIILALVGLTGVGLKISWFFGALSGGSPFLTIILTCFIRPEILLQGTALLFPGRLVNLVGFLAVVGIFILQKKRDWNAGAKV